MIVAGASPIAAPGCQRRGCRLRGAIWRSSAPAASGLLDLSVAQVQRNLWPLRATSRCSGRPRAASTTAAPPGSRATSCRDLFVVLPLGIAAWALVTAAAPRDSSARARQSPCWAKCAAAALAAATKSGALAVLNATLRAHGPRAVLDWWDPRLWLFAAEHAAWGVIANAAMIADLLVALLGAARLALLALTLMMLQIEFFARIIARYPRGALLGSSIAVAGPAIVSIMAHIPAATSGSPIRICAICSAARSGVSIAPARRSIGSCAGPLHGSGVARRSAR